MQLFEPIVEEAKRHPIFCRLLSENNQFDRAVLNDWAANFVDRDKKFVKEFQTTFESSFWELYLFAVLKQYGMDVDFTKNQPDFYIPDRGINIEAVVASCEQGGLPAYGPGAPQVPDDLNEFNRKSIIRLANAFTSKWRKFVSEYIHLPHVAGHPFVIAIATLRDRQASFLTCQRAIEALLYNYYVDEEAFLAEIADGAEFAGSMPGLVRKDNGSEIPLGAFTSGTYKEISAVIFSSTASWGKMRALSQDLNAASIFSTLRLNMHSVFPHKIVARKSEHRESLLDGLRIYHNPHATYSLDPAIFRHLPDVFQTLWDEQDEWVHEQADGQLLSRFIFSLQRNQ